MKRFSLKKIKSPGIENLPGVILKASCDYIAPFLLTVFNRLLNTGEYPRAWGEGIITPIFKKCDVNEASNYRGITLMNILAKVYSKLLLTRVTKWTEIYITIIKISLVSERKLQYRLYFYPTVNYYKSSKFKTKIILHLYRLR